MKIVIIGAGYVGLVSAACFAEFGFNVVCIDRVEGRIANIESGKMPIYEPGLAELIAKNREQGRLRFELSLSHELDEADAVFIAVGTPARRGDGYADLSYVYAAGEEVGRALKKYIVVVTKSTVPVGTSRELTSIIREANPNAEFDVCSNPEFLREGSAINDFMRPDRVIIGCESERAQTIMRALYRPLYLIETPIVMTSLESSELIKYASNAYLATKITFINEIADLCESVGADVQVVAKGMGLDGRIGRKFLHAGPGYGGSCFPKDTQAFVRTAEAVGTRLRIVETTIQVNEDRKKIMASRIIDASGGSVEGKRIAILGLTFKPNTDDLRESVSLTIIPLLLEAGAKVAAYDPQGMKEAAHHFPTVEWGQDPYQPIENADALVFLTEWNEFRALDLKRVRQLMRTPLVVDLRNIYQNSDMMAAGLSYVSIGRGTSLRR